MLRVEVAIGEDATSSRGWLTHGANTQANPSRRSKMSFVATAALPERWQNSKLRGRADR